MRLLGNRSNRSHQSVLRYFVGAVAVLAAGPGAVGAAFSAETAKAYDVVVYGGTSSGVAAAVQVARMGRSIVLIEPGRHLGGLSSGGLGATDIGNKRAIGGMAREFYQRVYLYYANDDAWIHGTRQEYLDASKGRKAWEEEQAWWVFEPSAAEAVFSDMIREANVPVVYDCRLDLNRGVRKEGPRIVAITMEGNETFAGKMFIDATYEGDLMAKAGVSYAVGREANAQYGETINGVQPNRQAERYYEYHQFMKPVDPYVKPGDPSNGLLPDVNNEGPGQDGAGDHRVQAYCFRTCLTDNPDNMVPIQKPKDYDPLRYELLFRYYEAGFDKIPVTPFARALSPQGLSPAAMLPNRKTDNNNIHAVSIDYTGMNYGYPDGDYAAREKIVREHVSYQQGLYWTLANHPRVPQQIRNPFSCFGLARDEFVDNGNWPHQLYIREARRMVSDYVMTEHDCLGRRTARDSVGLGAYPMDSHNTQRYVDHHGQVRNEGNVQTEGNLVFPPYPISYRSLVPKAEECSNLLVPVCVSASHIAFGSIRMEPAFMVLGQSAATAACLAIDGGVEVQRVDYTKLKDRLLSSGQVLEWEN